MVPGFFFAFLWHYTCKVIKRPYYISANIHMRLQKTLRHEVGFEGIGLHTGRYAKVRLKPASRDTGIVFVRAERQVAIKASIDAVTDTAFSTSLGLNGTKIRTVEHILAAIAGIGIDNLIIEVTGPEIPILDGSSIELTSLLMKSGIAKQSKNKPRLKITKPLVLLMGMPSWQCFPITGDV